MRVRLTTAKRATPETVMERAIGARLSKHVIDLPLPFVTRFERVQAEWWQVQAELDRLRREA